MIAINSRRFNIRISSHSTKKKKKKLHALFKHWLKLLQPSLYTAHHDPCILHATKDLTKITLTYKMVLHDETICTHLFKQVWWKSAIEMNV